MFPSTTLGNACSYLHRKNIDHEQHSCWIPYLWGCQTWWEVPHPSRCGSGHFRTGYLLEMTWCSTRANANEVLQITELDCGFPDYHTYDNPDTLSNISSHCTPCSIPLTEGSSWVMKASISKSLPVKMTNLQSDAVCVQSLILHHFCSSIVVFLTPCISLEGSPFQPNTEERSRWEMMYIRKNLLIISTSTITWTT